MTSWNGRDTLPNANAYTQLYPFTNLHLFFYFLLCNYQLPIVKYPLLYTSVDKSPLPCIYYKDYLTSQLEHQNTAPKNSHLHCFLTIKSKTDIYDTRTTKRSMGPLRQMVHSYPDNEATAHMQEHIKALASSRRKSIHLCRRWPFSAMQRGRLCLVYVEHAWPEEQKEEG